MHPTWQRCSCLSDYRLYGLGDAEATQGQLRLVCAKDACALLPAFEASVRVSAMFENVFGTRTGIVADDDHRPAYECVR
jgi:hypothetical protein